MRRISFVPFILNNCVVFQIHSLERICITSRLKNCMQNFADTKTKTKGKMKPRVKPQCHIAHAENVGITVNCVECEKPLLLFSARNSPKKTRQYFENSWIQSILAVCRSITHVIQQWLLPRHKK
jgi:hypothetical protein